MPLYVLPAGGMYWGTSALSYNTALSVLWHCIGVAFFMPYHFLGSWTVYTKQACISANDILSKIKKALHLGNRNSISSFSPVRAAPLSSPSS